MREYISALLAERSGKKPGGPRTDVGALRQLNPEKFSVAVKGAVKGAEGDVDSAAEKLGVAPRTLYHYLETEPSLGGVETGDGGEE